MYLKLRFVCASTFLVFLVLGFKHLRIIHKTGANVHLPHESDTHFSDGLIKSQENSLNNDNFKCNKEYIELNTISNVESSSDTVNNHDFCSNYLFSSGHHSLDNSSKPVGGQNFEIQEPYSKEEKDIPAGFSNPANDCYLNSSVQALFSCSSFIKKLVEFINQFTLMKSEDLLYLSPIDTARMNILLELRSLYIEHYNVGVSSTSNLKNLILLLDKRFDGDRQEDASELISLLLDIIQSLKIYIPKRMTYQKGTALEEYPQENSMMKTQLQIDKTDRTAKSTHVCDSSRQTDTTDIKSEINKDLNCSISETLHLDKEEYCSINEQTVETFNIGLENKVNGVRRKSLNKREMGDLNVHFKDQVKYMQHPQLSPVISSFPIESSNLSPLGSVLRLPPGVFYSQVLEKYNKLLESFSFKTSSMQVCSVCSHGDFKSDVDSMLRLSIPSTFFYHPNTFIIDYFSTSYLKVFIPAHLTVNQASIYLHKREINQTVKFRYGFFECSESATRLIPGETKLSNLKGTVFIAKFDEKNIQSLKSGELTISKSDTVINYVLIEIELITSVVKEKEMLIAVIKTNSALRLKNDNSNDIFKFFSEQVDHKFFKTKLGQVFLSKDFQRSMVFEPKINSNLLIDKIKITIKEQGIAQRLSECLITTSFNDKTIYDSLNFYLNERISKDCAICKKSTSFDVRTKLIKFPDTLIVQVKRFIFDYRSIKDLTKLHFPTRQLVFKDGNSQVKYKLVACINHIGNTLESGHYMSYINKHDIWYLCNDRLVHQVDRVSKKSAYLLFYEKCQSDRLTNVSDNAKIKKIIK